MSLPSKRLFYLCAIFSNAPGWHLSARAQPEQQLPQEDSPLFLFLTILNIISEKTARSARLIRIVARFANIHETFLHPFMGYRIKRIGQLGTKSGWLPMGLKQHIYYEDQNHRRSNQADNIGISVSTDRTDLSSEKQHRQIRFDNQLRTKSTLSRSFLP